MISPIKRSWNLQRCSTTPALY